MTITGLEQLERNMIQLRARGGTKVAVELEKLGETIVREIRRNISQPFQSLGPTYIYETERLGRHGGPGKYPPGTIGIFSTRAASIGTRLSARAQLYDAPSDHRLVNELDFELVDNDRGTLTLEIGYPEESIQGSDKAGYIRDVLFGTAKMQPRNFLAEYFRQSRNPFIRAMREAGRRLILK